MADMNQGSGATGAGVSGGQGAGGAAGANAPTIIKKYANRRLYNTATSSYVTLDHLCQMVKQGKEFVVHDAKTGEDITRSVLTQIIFEEESKGQNMLPVGFLRQLISFYGDSLQSLVPGYLEVSMSSFHRNQEQMRKSLSDAFGEMFPFRGLEEMGRQNMAVFERAMTMFNPFAAMQGHDSGKAKADADSKASGQSAAELDTLKSQLNALQKQIDALGRK